jgi:formylglycine-generating enzyme required for sulfatase activity
MVVIPPGKFVMGSPPSEPGRFGTEGLAHIVSIEKAFAVGKYEVTRAELWKFARATSGHMNGCGYWEWDGKRDTIDNARSWEKPGFAQSDEEPAVCVNWEDVQAYAKWLSQQSGRTYRLLSEAEWEYVARAGSQEPYAWGHDENLACQFSNVHDLSGKQERISPKAELKLYGRYVYTAPAGSFKPNACGLHDMHGNVWEWTEDCSNDSYKGAPIDGRVWSTGNCSRRVARGGSWESFPRFIRFAGRGTFISTVRFMGLGFRLARTLP